MSNANCLDTSAVIGDIEAWDLITDHRTGTDGDTATDEWLTAQIEKLGLLATVDPFDFTRVIVHDCYVDVGGHKVSGVPMFDGASTGPTALRGTLGEDLICAPCAPHDAHPVTLAMQKIRRNPDCQALIAVSAAQGIQPGLALLNAEHYREPFGPPVAQVSSVHNELLSRASAERVPAAVLVDIERVAATASNVHTRIQGRDPKLRPIVVMTPKSAWWTCTAERMGGICVWLALLRHFANNPPARNLLFTANTGHELSHLGLDDFLQKHGESSAEFWLHLGANFASRDGQVRVQASTTHYLDVLTRRLSDHGIRPAVRTPVADRPAGEARNIFDIGGHYLSMLGSNPYFHHPQDRWPLTVDLDKTCAIIAAFLDVMDELANA